MRPASASPPTLTAHAWSGLDGLYAATEAWARVLARAKVDPLCNAPEWAAAHGEAYAEPSSLFGWTVTDSAGEPVAVLPFRREPPRSPIALRRAILAADGTFDSDYLDLPIVAGFERPVVDLCFEMLARHEGLEAAVLSCVPEESATLAAWRDRLREAGSPSREIGVPCCAAQLPTTFDAYLAGLKPRMRSKVRSAIRKTEARGGRLLWCNEPAPFARQLDEFYDLHTRRWAAAGRPGSFGDLGRRRFYGSIGPELLRRGRLRFARLEIDGVAVAYQFGAIAGDRYYQIQEGFDPTLSDLRVGTALRGLVLQKLIAEGIRTYDFMAGESRHKEEWGAQHRGCVSLAFPLPGGRGRWAFQIRNSYDRWRARRATARGAAPSPAHDDGEAGDSGQVGNPPDADV